MINILCGIIGVIFFLRADANREKLDRYYRMDIDIEKEEIEEIINLICMAIFLISAFIDWEITLTKF